MSTPINGNGNGWLRLVVAATTLITMIVSLIRSWTSLVRPSSPRQDHDPWQRIEAKIDLLISLIHKDRS